MRNKTYELYITKNNVTGCVYGGKHSYTNKRGVYLGSGFRLKRAFKKYGKENFSVRILRLKLASEEDMNAREIRLIRLLKYVFKDKCYNIHRGGSGGDYYKYLTPEERLKVNLRISESKKLQYSRGETDAQKLGRTKQSIKLKEKNKNDSEFYNTMKIKLQEKGKRLSERIKQTGLTEKEVLRNKKRSELGIYRITFEIRLPDGCSYIETLNSKKFKEKYKTDDSVFAKLRKDSYYKITKIQHKTKHKFPLGTEFIQIKN
jgi:hypothetical protein